MANDQGTEVFAQIVIDLELSEFTISGTQLDLMGLSKAVKEFLENLPMSGPQMRVTNVYSPTKDWQIGAQLSLGQPFRKDTIT